MNNDTRDAVVVAAGKRAWKEYADLIESYDTTQLEGGCEGLTLEQLDKHIYTGTLKMVRDCSAQLLASGSDTIGKSE